MYLVRENGGENGIVGGSNDEVVVEVVIAVRSDRITQVWLYLEVAPKAFVVFRNTVAQRGYAVFCRTLKIS